MIVSVFKTSIKEEDIGKINFVLKNAPTIHRWSFDLDDCDRILRAESIVEVKEEVCQLMKCLDIWCEELT